MTSIQYSFCDQCGRAAIRRYAMTAYYWDGKGDNPNQDLFLCNDCWLDYEEYWKERWDEYYSGLL